MVEGGESMTAMYGSVIVCVLKHSVMSSSLLLNCAFELWCWRRLLRDPWTARRSNQSIRKIRPGISLEGRMLEAETPVLWPPHAKS